MISKKDLAPLDNPDFSVWLATLKHRKNKTLWALHGFCQDFFSHGVVQRIIWDANVLIA